MNGSVFSLSPCEGAFGLRDIGVERKSQGKISIWTDCNLCQNCQSLDLGRPMTRVFSKTANVQGTCLFSHVFSLGVKVLPELKLPCLCWILWLWTCLHLFKVKTSVDFFDLSRSIGSVSVSCFFQMKP